MEPLHTCYLGVYKYSWGLTITALREAGHLETFQIRLQSINVDGLNIDSLRAAYMIQYNRSLIGRHFRAIVQTIVFALYGLVPDSYISLWVAAGHLASLLWFTEIERMPDYCVSYTKGLHRLTSN